MNEEISTYKILEMKSFLERNTGHEVLAMFRLIDDTPIVPVDLFQHTGENNFLVIMNESIEDILDLASNLNDLTTTIIQKDDNCFHLISIRQIYSLLNELGSSLTSNQIFKTITQIQPFYKVKDLQETFKMFNNKSVAKLIFDYLIRKNINEGIQQIEDVVETAQQKGIQNGSHLINLKTQKENIDFYNIFFHTNHRNMDIKQFFDYCNLKEENISNHNEKTFEKINEYYQNIVFQEFQKEIKTLKAKLDIVDMFISKERYELGKFIFTIIFKMDFATMIKNEIVKDDK